MESDPLVSIDINPSYDGDHLRLGCVETVHPAELEQRPVRQITLSVGINCFKGAPNMPVKPLVELDP